MFSNMITQAELDVCHVELRVDLLNDLLTGWKAKTSRYRNVGIPSKEDNAGHTRKSPCPAKEGEAWFSMPLIPSACPAAILRDILEINHTHALGRACPSRHFAALHVRSGDIASGMFNSTSGAYLSSVSFNNFWLAPTSYYTSALQNIRARHPGMKTLVFCETLDNPTCEFFRKLERIESDIELRVGHSLLSDLHLILCADEIAKSAAISTFRRVIDLSIRNPIEHTFTERSIESKNEVIQCDQSNSNAYLYFISNKTEAEEFITNVKFWNNTAYQRFLTNRDYDIGYIKCSKLFCSDHRCRSGARRSLVEIRAAESLARAVVSKAVAK